ncbi:hypothetical protein PHLCEN_2v7727 [Hermanssonia centrifuga]|uniref:Pre-mRNA-splicing factor PRP46 n=1 Tax=Hermanssonia centrifuga TaxID=98765 RepID=A0A2R6NVS9_9APHY|nr:hypothetical protein PHLCEN_2v7727 [Hermanssonia centrifuga]
MDASSLPPLNSLLKASGKRTWDVFASCPDDSLKEDEKIARVRLSVKISDEYKDARELPASLLAQQGQVGPARPKEQRKMITAGTTSDASRMIAAIDNTPTHTPSTFSSSSNLSKALQLHKTIRTIKPTYHPPWKLMRVISGHLGWVRSVAVEPGNKWFATGAGDRVIKIWDLASGELKLSLTGHISTVRGLAVSSRHPYLFSCGEDKMRSRLWDLAAGKTRVTLTHHKKSVRALAIHPTEYSFASASAGGNNIKKWKCPEGAFVFNFSGHNAIINTLSVNSEGVFFSGGT